MEKIPCLHQTMTGTVKEDNGELRMLICSKNNYVTCDQNTPGNNFLLSDEDDSTEGHYDLPDFERKETLHSDESVHSCISKGNEVTKVKTTLQNQSDKEGSNVVINCVKSPIRMFVTGMTALSDDRVVIVTQSGEIIVFDSHLRFSFLREFLERYEDVTLINGKTIATTSGYCIRFYSVKDSNILELKDRLIDFELEGCVSVHGIHYFHDKLAVTCNIQSIFATAKPYIRIIDLKGRLIRTIDKLDLQIPSKIACSSNGQMIFVCDQGLNTVLCVSHTGNILWERAERKTSDIELVNDSELFVIFREPRTVIGMTPKTGHTNRHAVTNTTSTHVPSLLGYQTQKRQLVCCLEELIVGNPDFIFPVSIKKAKGTLLK